MLDETRIPFDVFHIPTMPRLLAVTGAERCENHAAADGSHAVGRDASTVIPDAASVLKVVVFRHLIDAPV